MKLKHISPDHGVKATSFNFLSYKNGTYRRKTLTPTLYQFGFLLVGKQLIECNLFLFG